MLKKLKQELCCLADIRIPLIVLTVLAAALGILTWVTAGGIPFFWRLLKKPPFTPPLVLFFVLWMLTYVLFGVFAAICTGSCRASRSPLINAVAGYFLSLFWCPLFFGGKIVISLFSLIVSALVIIPASVRCGRVSSLIFCASVPLWLMEAYFIFLNVGFIAVT